MINRWLHHQQRLVLITITSSSFSLLATVVSFCFYKLETMRSSYHPFVLKGFCFGCYDYGCITAFDLVGEQMGM